MRAVIMAGGRGTRLQPLTRRAPKPMLQLVDRPIIEYIVELLKKHHFRDITITVCYMADVIKSYFGDGAEWDVHIDYLQEDMPCGTAGGVKLLQENIGDTFVVMSGDGLTDFNLSEAVVFHRSTGALATLLVKRVECPLGYGVVDIEATGRITGFIEKPKTWTRGGAYYINTGIYLLEPEIMDFIPADRPYDFGHELFPTLVSQGLPVYGYEPQGYWSDVGTLQQYYQSQIDMITGRVQVTLPPEVATVH